MQEDSEVFPIDAELAADILTIAFFQKHSFQ
jgi:hypothetical protein